MNATATAPTLSRDEILAEINDCETRLIELRTMLPSCLKSFFRFRVKPGKFAWVYADCREIAGRKLRERMDRDYKPDELNRPGWEIVSKVVDIYHDAEIAATNTPGSLLTSLMAADAAEFVRDYRENERGRIIDPNRPKNLPPSQVERDVAHYEERQRQQAK